MNIDATGNPPTAGQLIKGGGTALGGAELRRARGRDIVWTAAGAAKLFDILGQAAPGIIATLPNSAAVPDRRRRPTGLHGRGRTCVEDAISCLIGRPATPDHVAICNSLVASASDIETGKKVAVATLLSAAHSCE
ncbi:MAG: hypothetical protein IPM79_02335 [Polyangiaceae bacterium]|nr:hypothetical protein [Polyangiaceae bacterium]